MRSLSMRSGNPALNKNTFKNITHNSDEVMTLDGTVNKTTISLLILILSAYYTFSMPIEKSVVFVFPGLIGGFIVALITIFKKHLAPYTVPLYSILEGLALGGISAIYNSTYTNIVQDAIFITFGIFCALLFAYKTNFIKATENFKLGVFAATGGIGIVYLINFIMMFFGNGLGIMSLGTPENPASLMSVGFSVFVVIMASLNLVLDFDFIEHGAESGAPKYMEWYGAFGLLVTLVWLYLEILRLLAKLQSRRD
tara:strand:+ start:78 stop:839 length:762 start_codon:yes stop_codon:yes gene_type:complete